MYAATHAPGAGGSSGQAINVLKNWPMFKGGNEQQVAPGGYPMNEDINSLRIQFDRSGLAPARGFAAPGYSDPGYEGRYQQAFQQWISQRGQQQEADRGRMEARADRDYTRGREGQAFTEDSRRFDERTNLLRMIMGGGSPFGGQPQTAYGQGDGWQGGRFTGTTAPSMGGMGMPVSAPDPMRKNIDNYLAQLLGRR